MRFLLHLDIEKGLNLLPFNYQYPVSAWIYKTIHKDNHEFAAFLHEKGFASGSRSYKLCTFSQFRFPPKGFHVAKNCMQLLCNEAQLELSFLVPEAMQHFISGLFREQNFSIGDKQSKVNFRVRHVEALPFPDFENMASFSALSPIMVSRYDENSKYAEYLKPGHADYERILFDNLLRKYTAALEAGLIENTKPDLDRDMNLRFRFKEPVKQKGILVKTGTPMQTQLVGYMYDFEMTASRELLYIGYFAGFGEKNSLGMGCVKHLT
jgi:CRISPR-associated endoribonuclease Cas6